MNAPPPVPDAVTGWLRPSLVARWGEIALVLTLLAGLFIGRSAWAAWHGSDTHYIDALLTDQRLLNNGAMEALLLALFVGFLHWRGWTPADFRLKPGWASSGQGILLLVPTMLANGAVVFACLGFLYAHQTTYTTFLSFLTANAPHLKAHSIAVTWTVLVASMVLNAFFEEMIFTGYGFCQIAAKVGPLAALLLVVMLRMACHTYQGPVHMLGIGAVFLIYGTWYWHTRNLWTLVFAHAVADLASTSFVKMMYG